MKHKTANTKLRIKKPRRLKNSETQNREHKTAKHKTVNTKLRIKEPQRLQNSETQNRETQNRDGFKLAPRKTANDKENCDRSGLLTC